MTLEFLLAWWNLIFLVPLGLGLLYMGLYIATGVTFGDGDADTGADADGHVDVDADAHVDVDADGHVDLDADADAHPDVDADGDLDADTDAHVDAEADADAHDDAHHGHGHAAPHPHHTGPGAMSTALALLGVGRVPFSVALMVLVLLWGVIGLVVNRLLYPVATREWLLPLVAVPLAAVGSAFFTGLIARAMGRLMPLDETTVRPKRDLVGRVGEALYDINDTFGMAVVKDARGERYQVPCRITHNGAVIPKGEDVLLVHYDPDDDQYIVREYDLLPKKQSLSPTLDPPARSTPNRAREQA